MTATRGRPQVGDTRWQVDYIAETPLDEHGECNPDDAVHKYRNFATMEEAREWCRANFSKACTGFMEIDQIEFTAYDESDPPWVGSWSHIGETEYVGYRRVIRALRIRHEEEQAMLDTTPERQMPREAWRRIFHDMDAEIDKLVRAGADRETAYGKVAGHALAKQAEAAQQAAREGR